MKYVVKLKDGREFEGVRTVTDAVCPLGLSLLKRDYPDSMFRIPSATGEEIRITFESVQAIEVIF